MGEYEFKGNVNAGAVGDNSSNYGPVGHVAVGTLQIGGQELDANKLASELRSLADEVSGAGAAGDVDHGDEAERLRSAADKAEAGDGTGVVAVLKKVGSWVIGIATQIGVPLAIAALKAASGLP